MKNYARFRRFIADFTRLIEQCGRPSISIHVYGANIGAVARHVFDPATGAAKPFVSGYSLPVIPNFWDRSADVRATLQKTA